MLGRVWWAAGLEEALEADAVEGGDEEAGRLRALLSTLGEGLKYESSLSL